MPQPLLGLVWSFISGGWVSNKSKNGAQSKRHAKDNGEATGVTNELAWISMFLNDVVVSEVRGRCLPRFRHYRPGAAHSLITWSGAVCLAILSGVR